ncbi:MAG: ATP-binding cassette domain-containing protein, partial [Ruminococcus sp.]|nr:ATP-binding cassette domain-containing protein [Ruminococcus sp.]
MSEVAIELKSITKRFGSVVANNKVSLKVNKGEILSILGENGSGKTTLMNMLSGIYYPDEGHIYVDGKEVSIKSPKDAFDYKIGMIHQHFKLVDVLTVAENIVLGLNEKEKYNIKKSAKKISEICEQFGFEVDPMKRIYEMSVSEKQTVEIIKVIYRGAEVLILDEPTAVLTPKETEKLFAILRNMKNSGKAIIIITHKLNEVLAISDRVSVLRKGEYIGTVETKDATEQSLTEMMVGKKVSLNIERSEPKNQENRLVLTNVSVVNNEGVSVLKNVNFTAKSGEILGIAGIAGSGQKELLESIAGLQHLKSGSIVYHDPSTGKEENLKDKTPLQIRNLGVRLSFVPEDRLG